MEKVRLADLLYVQSLGNYIKLFFSDKMIITYMTLQQMESLLPQPPFYRIHKSYLINIHSMDHLEGNMIRIGRHVLPLGKSYRNDFYHMLKGCQLF